MGRRIWIKGGSGAGKSTLGRALAKRLNVPYIELDALHHGPNWEAASALQLQTRIASALDDDCGWVLDGNYDEKLGFTVLERVELIVWLDLPLTTKLLRLSRRTTRRWLEKEELWGGNRETLKDVFWGQEALFPGAIRSHILHRREWPRQLRQGTFVRLNSAKEIDTWLSAFVA